MLIAAVAMFDTRKGALPDPSGAAPGGLGSGFYPFWSAMVVFVAGAIVAYRSLLTPQPVEDVFKSRQGVLSVVKLVVPMLVAVAAIAWSGIYIMTAAYLSSFMITIGKYRWQWGAIAGIVLAAVLYVMFEIFFRVTLPKSIFYEVLRF